MIHFSRLLIATAIFATSGVAMAQTEDGPKFEIDRYASAKSWDVNAYMLVSESGVVLIDALLLKSDAEKLAKLIKATGKPFRGVVLTHPHPDHYGGLPILRERLGEFPIYATPATIDTMVEAHEEFMNNMGSPPNPDLSMELVMPDRAVESGSTIDIAGIPLLFDDLGPGEAPDNTVIYQADRRILFTGDATMHHKHYYLGEGRSKPSLEQFRYMKEKYADARVFLTGHGDPARPSILDQHIEYVESLRALLREMLGNAKNLVPEKNHLTEEARKAFAAAIVSKYPYLGDYGFDAAALIIWSLPRFETEILAEMAAK